VFGQFVAERCRHIDLPNARVRLGLPNRDRPGGKAHVLAIEGIVAVVAGIVAGSIALIGFGLDSAIEGFASVIIVWRFTGWRTLSHEAEERAQNSSRSSSSSSPPTWALSRCGR
jgi:hypothetical protein